MSNIHLYFISCLTLFSFYFSENLNFDLTFLGEFARWFDSLKVKYVILLVACLIMHASSVQVVNKTVFSPEKRFFCWYISIIVITTLSFQLKNGFRAYSISELLYILTPFFFVFYCIKSIPELVEKLITTSFYLALTFFFYFIIYQILHGSGLSDINPLESFSPFESGLAPYFVFFEIYYLSKNDNKKVLLCAFLSILSLKRLCLLKAILLLIFLFKKKVKQVPKVIYYASISVFILAPLIVEFIYSEIGVALIEDVTGMNISLLTMSRNSLTAIVLDEVERHNYGLGTTVALITGDGGDLANAGSLHSDILRIYVEGTILSTIVFTISYFKMVRNYAFFSFLAVFHYFSEGLFNHYMLGAGNTCQLILFYLLIYCLNRQDVKSNLNYKRMVMVHKVGS